MPKFSLPYSGTLSSHVNTCELLQSKPTNTVNMDKALNPFTWTGLQIVQ